MTKIVSITRLGGEIRILEKSHTPPRSIKEYVVFGSEVLHVLFNII